MEYPKISIITPSYNQGAYLDETINSILSQNYPNLEYIIIDGGSSEDSVDIIKKYDKRLAYWVSEKDGGLYDALQKGFSKATGEIMGWLNADDLLHRKSLFVLANVFTNLQQVNWLQGMPTVYNESGMTVSSRPAVSSRYHFYLKKYADGRFIQQESTFWRRSLWEKAGSHISTTYAYAGDFELWMRFFTHADLFITDALIGGFRVRKSQLSQQFYREYLEECHAVIDQQSLTPVWAEQIRKIKFAEKYRAKSKMLSRITDDYYQSLFGPAHQVHFDFESGKFVT